MTYFQLLKVFEDIKIQFNNSQLLEQAFIHRSFLNESKVKLESNERLEFLGDSVLSFVVSNYLYKRRSQDPEGDLTNLRSYIVKTKSLAKAAARLELGKNLKLSKGEELTGGRKNMQLLANTYEAVLGATFLDQGLEKAEVFVLKTLIYYFEEEIEQGPPKDAKSQLQEIIQVETKESPLYKIIKTFGPDHAKRFLIGVFVKSEKMGEGEGTNKQEAEEEAAKQALRRLEVK